MWCFSLGVQMSPAILVPFLFVSFLFSHTFYFPISSLPTLLQGSRSTVRLVLRLTTVHVTVFLLVPFVCDQLDYPATYGPEGHVSSSTAARAAVSSYIFPHSVPVRYSPASRYFAPWCPAVIVGNPNLPHPDPDILPGV